LSRNFCGAAQEKEKSKENSRNNRAVPATLPG
jgi:hypothetical protein